MSPAYTTYSPDGRTLLYTSAGNQLYSLALGLDSTAEKEIWAVTSDSPKFNCSKVVFNWAGTALAVVHQTESQIRIVEWPSLIIKETLPAHVGGCVALALHPGGRLDTIPLNRGGVLTYIQIFGFWRSGFYRQSIRCRWMDMHSNHIYLRVSVVVRHLRATLTPSNSNAINSLSFSHDGEYLAIANTGSYIDIVRIFHFIFHSNAKYTATVCYWDRCTITSSENICTLPSCCLVSNPKCNCLLWSDGG